MNIDPRTMKMLVDALMRLRQKHPEASVDDAIEMLNKGAVSRTNQELQGFQSLAKNIKPFQPGGAKLESKKVKMKENALLGGAKGAALKQVLDLIRSNPEILKQAGDMINAATKEPGAVSGMGGVREGKTFKITQQNLVECIKKGIELHENKKSAVKFINEELNRQKELLALTESYLNEGPLSNAFSAAKKGVGNFMSKFGGGNKPNPATYGSGGEGDTYRQDRMKDLQKFVANAQKARQKFNADVLKTGQNLSSYHDAVVGAVQTMKRVGPPTPSDTPQQTAIQDRLTDEVRNMVGNLYQDLESERVNVSKFLSGLQKEVPGAKTIGAEKALINKKRLEKERESGQSLRGGAKLAPQVKKGGQKANLPGAKNTREFEKDYLGPEVDKYKTIDADAARKKKRGEAELKLADYLKKNEKSKSDPAPKRPSSRRTKKN